MKATYTVWYSFNEDLEPEQMAIKAGSSGEAFAQCLHNNRDRKGCKLVKAVREGRAADGFGRTEFLPPPKYT